MIISNSSPLMYLTKINNLNLLKDLFKEILIPKEVYEEVVVRGKEGNFLDALKVEKAIKDGWIKVNETIIIDKDVEKFNLDIDIGELAVINLAQKIKPILILIDDASARVIAESFGFKVRGTLYVLLIAYRNKIISKVEIKSLLKLLILEGFRISTELYAQILEDIENI